VKHSATLTALVLALVIGAAAGCGGSGASSSSAPNTTSHRGGTLTILWSGVGTSIDPQVDYDQNWQLLVMTNDGLTAWKRVNGTAGSQLVPDLATAIPVPTDGGKTWLFHIRSGIHYSNGAVLTPADVTSSMEREFKVSGPGTGFLSQIVGAQACLKTPKTCNLGTGVVADNAAGTVTIHLTSPDPLLPEQLALPLSDVLPAGTPLKLSVSQPVPASGPYMIKTYNPNQQMILVRNPEFHQWSALAQPAGYPNEILLKIGLPIEEETTEIEQGQADWMYDQPSSDRLNEISTKYPSQVHVNPVPQLYYMALDTRTPPFNNLKARLAVNYATDRSAIIKLWGGPGVAEPSCQILPPNFPAYQPYCPFTKNPGTTWTAPDRAKAQQLVDQSGTKGDSVAVITATDSTSKNIGVYFVQLLDNLGYKARLKALAASVEYSVQQNSTFKPQISLSYWYPDYPDPADFFNLEVGCAGFHPKSDTSPNLSEFCDPAIQAMTAHALTVEETNRAAANTLWTAIDRATTNQAPQISLFVPKTVTFTSKRVGHVEFADSVDGNFLIDQAWVQ
jgi:peptide/nickel transport system substrate-binding protein